MTMIYDNNLLDCLALIVSVVSMVLALIAIIVSCITAKKNRITNEKCADRELQLAQYRCLLNHLVQLRKELESRCEREVICQAATELPYDIDENMIDDMPAVVNASLFERFVKAAGETRKLNDDIFEYTYEIAQEMYSKFGLRPLRYANDEHFFVGTDGGVGCACLDVDALLSAGLPQYLAESLYGRGNPVRLTAYSSSGKIIDVYLKYHDVDRMTQKELEQCVEDILRPLEARRADLAKRLFASRGEIDDITNCLKEGMNKFPR